jgi:hypothetical protein
MLVTALQDRVVRDKVWGAPARVTLFACAALHRRSCVFAIQLGNETGANLGWANRLTFVCIGAIAESFRIHYGDHSQHPTFSFRMALR